MLINTTNMNYLKIRLIVRCIIMREKQFWVTLSYKDESMVIPIEDKFKIGERRYQELKHQFNKFKSYIKMD